MPTRLRPLRLDLLVDGERLRAQLTDSTREGGSDVDARKRALEILKSALSRGRIIAKQRLEDGGGGVEVARLLCGLTDEVIKALYDYTVVHVFRARNPTEGERLTLLAVGGYGRGALAPFSDIDLLFLRPYKETAHTESVIEYMLYFLWDLGFKIGHASRTVTECIKLAGEDFTIRTSLLEARFLTGDEALAADLTRRFAAEVVKGTGPAFVAAKLKERDERHAKAGASRYLVEPNVKEGKGGLRDLHTLFWIAQYLNPGVGREGVLAMDLFTRQEVRTFLRAFDFLERVRAAMHFLTGRAEERLTFDLQPSVAEMLGYGVDEAGDNRAVERFMRHYFIIAKEVGTLTRVFIAKLESEHLKAEPRGLSRFLPRRTSRTARTPEGFPLDAGRLSVDDESVFQADPVNLLRVFQVADQRDVDLHPDAFTAARRSLALITPTVRRNPVAAQVFLDILAKGKKPRRTLELMTEAGVLGRYLPEFGRVVGQMQFNMYHSYTVDEHTLRAVGVINDIAQGVFAEDHPLCTGVMPLIEDKEALYLAMLLHDTGKGGVGGQEKAGARSARQACERMGLKRERIDLVAWLVEHHLVMSDFAQKRDVADPETVAAFARIVENPERLRLLLVLTVADIRAVGPGVWNGWKGQLLRELYAGAETIFRGGRISDAAGLARRRQQALAYDARAALAAEDPAVGAWAATMEDAYFIGSTVEDHRRHAGLSQAAQTGAAAGAVLRAERNAMEFALCAPDRRGLFADLALAIAHAGGNVVGARIYTSSTGQALDLFHVQDAAGDPFGGQSQKARDALIAALERAARGEVPHEGVPAQAGLNRSAAFTIPGAVAIDNDASATATVIEASGRDRPGLLEALARVIAEAELSLQSAHVENYGERAVDAFYVVTGAGEKVTDPKRQAAIRARLLEALNAADPALASTRLKRARASVAR